MTHATPCPRNCRIDGCDRPVCEPDAEGNRWAQNLCDRHVDAAFECGGCDRWLPDTEYASGPTTGDEPVCDECYKSGYRYYDPREAQREELGRIEFLRRSFGE